MCIRDRCSRTVGDGDVDVEAVGAPGGSVAINNMVRFGIDVHSVTLSNGTPDGQSESRFGTLMPGALFTGQTASGYSGEIQLSGDAFGLSFGTSPRGFLTDT